MAKLFDFSQLNPLKMYHQSDVFKVVNPNLQSFNPNYNHRHMDSDFFARNLKHWQDEVTYKQPYQNGDKIVLQWLGVVSPNYKFYLINCKGEIVINLDPILIAPLGTDFIWQVEVPLYNIDEGIYFSQLRYFDNSIAIVINTYMISEPIHIKAYHEGTMLYQYKNMNNRQHVIWSYGAEMQVRVHSAFTEMNPVSKHYVYENEPLNPCLVSSVPYREWSLNLGYDKFYIPEWLADKFERIFSCDTVKIDGKLFTRKEGSYLNAKRINGHPLAIWEIVVRENENRNDVEIDDNLSIVIGPPLPTTDLFYVGQITEQVGNTAFGTAIETYFKGADNFLAYMNTVFANVPILDGKVWFTLDVNNNLVANSDDPAKIALLDFNDLIIDNILPYSIIFENYSDFPHSLNLTLTNGTSHVSARVDSLGNSVPATTHVGSYPLNQSFLAGLKVTTYLFFDSMQSIENTFGSIVSIGGNLAPNTNFLNFQFNQISEIKNNLFMTCQGFLGIIDLSNNKLSTNEVNKLLTYLYDALQNGSLKITPSSGLTTNNQNPLAPPSNDVGIMSMIASLGNYNWNIITD